MKTIVGLIITYNEEKHIEELINNISFVDQIIVVDSFSTDATLEKLAPFSNVKVIQHKFNNFAEQRNFALKQVTQDWILFIDADERITKPLQKEILTTINSDTSVSGYMVKRLFYFKKKRIRFSGFQTDTTYRLFKTNKVTYIQDKIVHEMPKIEGETGLLKNNMLHYSFDSATHYKSKMEHYAKLKALELSKKGKTTNIFNLHLRPLYKFIVNYIFRLGFLDGKEGITLCYLSAYGVYYRYKTLKTLNN